MTCFFLFKFCLFDNYLLNFLILTTLMRQTIKKMMQLAKAHAPSTNLIVPSNIKVTTVNAIAASKIKARAILNLLTGISAIRNSR